MNEELELIFATTEEAMDGAIKHLEKELIKIRAGRANPSMLSTVKVDYYGSITPLSGVGNVSTPDARTITIQPWEKGMISEIEKAILNAGLGLNPSNNGEMVIINIPPLTEDRRKDLVKAAKAEAEHARVSIRAARKDANDALKKLKDEGAPEDLIKRNEDEVQKLTNTYNGKVDAVLEKKENDIMTV
ncbi:MAG: ribosome recycling factor [Cryomorphaceae bacterium]|nr:ribosome recycling factor [Cryomorphaceae bacterium]